MSQSAVLSETPPLASATSRWPDRSFRWLAIGAAFMIVVLIVLVGWQLSRGAHLAIATFGPGFLASSKWDPVTDEYGAWPFIYGTLLSSVLAIVIAVPLGVATALFLTEMAPLKLRQPVIMVIEMLAAVPSVIFGLWGIFMLVPWLRDHLFQWIAHSWLGYLPFFKGPIYGVSMLAGGIVVAIMILPIVTSISREILRSVPNLQREAAYALGATHWEVIRIAVLSYSGRGIFGAAILGLGRALGETMAVTMVIGNRPEVSASLFAPGYTLASAIANEFAEANSDLYLSSLFELGLVLLVVTLLVNAVAQLMMRTLTGQGTGKVK
ncbi:MAG TPA: phosphate ABC transporter permease subunit PstC [Candidatus Acidoferrales bacterium]|jgi:phosphate transport system permease protein|nr:phosphate ABC transporter permease subunit PstC [Candidatus Acidoferrales bacterium]